MFQCKWTWVEVVQQVIHHAIILSAMPTTDVMIGMCKMSHLILNQLRGLMNEKRITLLKAEKPRDVQGSASEGAK